MISLPSILGKIWDSSTIFSPVEKLADSIGPRPTGSANNIHASSYLEEQFTNLQYPVERQAFDVDIWIYEETSIPFKQSAISAIPFGFSSPGEVNGSILPIINPNQKKLEALNCSGKIVVYLNTMGGMGMMGGRGLSREELITKISDKGASGFIEVMNKPGGFIERRNLKINSSIPCVGISFEDGHLLLRTQEDLLLSVTGQKKTVTAENIIARTNQSSDKKIVLTAHYDTANDSPGAFDNASGVATLLELAQVFREFKSLPYSLEFVGLDASKWYFAGAQHYIDKNLDEAPHLVMNFDTTAKPAGTRNGVLANDIRLFGITKKLVMDYGFEINLTPMPIFGTDATKFFERKMPIFVINQWKSPTFINTPYDTPEKLSVDSLKNSTSIAGAILANVQNTAKMMKSSPIGTSRHPKSM